MSRSRKKVPGVSDSEGSKVKITWLRIMNRRIRRLETLEEDGWIPDGNLYRRFISRWSYRDYNFRFFSLREMERSWWAPAEVWKLFRK